MDLTARSLAEPEAVFVPFCQVVPLEPQATTFTVTRSCDWWRSTRCRSWYRLNQKRDWQMSVADRRRVPIRK